MSANDIQTADSQLTVPVVATATTTMEQTQKTLPPLLTNENEQMFERTHNE